MICKECGAKLYRSDADEEGRLACPGCGKRYRLKSKPADGVAGTKSAPAKSGAATRRIAAKAKASKRSKKRKSGGGKIILIVSLLALIAAAVVIAVVVKGGTDGGKTDSGYTADNTTSSSGNSAKVTEKEIGSRVDDEITSGDYDYCVLSDDTVEITYYRGDAKKVSIPSKLDGRKVSVIGDNAFDGNREMTEVSIPDGVIRIGESAFELDNLKSVKLPNSVQIIDRRAFQGCQLTSITLPGELLRIGEEAFDSTNLKSVTIPGSVKRIGTGAFKYCGSLSKVEIKYGVESIGKEAFTGCAITSLTIPGSIEKIGEEAFSDCEKLSKLVIENGVTSIGKNAFHMCESLGKVTIPGSVKEIGDHAFSESGVSTVTLEDGVERISRGAFDDCRNLKSVSVPASVSFIGENAFTFDTSKDLVLKVKPGSYAETFCKENGYNYDAGKGVVALWKDEDEYLEHDEPDSNRGANLPGNSAGVTLPSNTKTSQYQVGQIITFGAYEQDRDRSNGSEPIEWIVIGTENDGTLVLLSRYALEALPYNYSNRSTTWETCWPREWLNAIFYGEAFTEAEKASILTTKVKNGDDNLKYAKNGGNDTEDKVYLLSIYEAQNMISEFMGSNYGKNPVYHFLDNDEARKCAPTDSAVAHGVYQDSSYSKDWKHTCYWWLRSPGESSDRAACVRPSGRIDNTAAVSNSTYGVRPVIRIQPAGE